MLRIIFCFSLFFSCTIFAQSITQDPFNKQQRQKHSPSSTSTTALDCAKLPRLAAQTPIEQIKIIGIVFNAKQKHILFLDAQQQIFSASINEFIAKEGLQIQQIESQHIHFLDWRNSKNCTSPTSFTLKF